MIPMKATGSRRKSHMIFNREHQFGNDITCIDQNGNWVVVKIPIDDFIDIRVIQGDFWDKCLQRASKVIEMACDPELDSHEFTEIKRRPQFPK
ncbi:MAG: hypothetical protein M0R80_13470 [Proteobacteria bacterium]|jgi:hypothetical protein|nr:hypothetical protein [Pseudomonadota bacterium]